MGDAPQHIPAVSRNKAKIRLLGSSLMFLLFITATLPLFFCGAVDAATISVPDDYPTIQAAINAASPGDTVYVRAGTYDGKIVVNKSVSLIGESQATTILKNTDRSSIDAGNVVEVRANGALVANFTIREGMDGIRVEDCNDTVIRNNKIINNAQGITVANCTNATLLDNTVNDNMGGMYGWIFSGGGIELYESSYCTMRNNSMRQNMDDFIFSGSELPHFLHDIDPSNLVIDGTVRRIYYLVNETGESLSPATHPDLGLLFVVNCQGVLVEGFTFVDNKPGVLLAFTSHSTVRGCTFRACNTGVLLDSCSNCTVEENTFSPGNTVGVSLDHSANSTVSGNLMKDNLGTAVVLQWSPGNTVSGNEIENCSGGVILWHFSDHNSVLGNTMANAVSQTGYEGGGITIWDSTGNVLRDNAMSNFSYGLGMEVGPVEVFDEQNCELDHFIHDIDASNTVDGKPIYYLINQHGTTVSPATHPQAASLFLVNSSGVAVSDMVLNGLSLFYVNGATVSNVSSTRSWRGILLFETTGSAVSGCTASLSDFGIRLYNSTGNTVEGCLVEGNEQHGIWLEGDSSGNAVIGNTIRSNGPIYGNGIRLDYSPDNEVVGNTVTDCNNGIRLQYSPYCTISGNNASANRGDGIDLGGSGNDHTAIVGNTASDNTDCGVYLSFYCNFTSIVGNTLTGNGKDGIYLIILGSYMNITGNTIGGNGKNGIAVSYLEDSAIANNSIAGNAMNGISLSYISTNNSIVWNNVTSNTGSGIYLDNSSGNAIHHNRLAGNGNQTWSKNSTNTWDLGYTSGGNYWGDYVGTDRFSGQGQNVPGGDGFGDTPKVLDSLNTDHYPLTGSQPYSVTITASGTSGAGVAITKDGVASGQSTPYTFTSLQGEHTFAVPGSDASGRAFSQWSNGGKTTSLTVTGAGSHEAAYAAGAGPDYTLLIILAIIAATLILLLLFYYRKKQDAGRRR
jgi:parallel beta-helix repeat protein